MEVRNRIKVSRDEGKSVKIQIDVEKKVKAGKCFISGTFRLGKTVFDVVIEKMQKRKTISNTHASKARVDSIEKVTSATAIKALGKPNSVLKVTQLKVMIATLRQ